ncbi:MAG: hypothetical protein SFV21_02710 [Rhodospirillaceae bacterium]|nr:hypothetical protein [Rhodospirillaceae bacterium]
MATVSVTRLKLRSWRFFPAFVWHAVRSARQARAAFGCLGVELRHHDGAWWTLTAWRDAAAMRGFMLSGDHRTAMPRLTNWCDEAAVARFEPNGDEMPSWEVAEDVLMRQGRTSSLRHPSPAQAEGLTLGEAGRARGGPYAQPPANI